MRFSPVFFKLKDTAGSYESRVPLPYSGASDSCADGKENGKEIGRMERIGKKESDPDPLIEKARTLAEQKHAVQTDKAGLPYIGHPERVASRMKERDEIIVGWLHDTVEDTDLSLLEIAETFGARIADAVDAISRRPDEKWGVYLRRVKANPIARKVKISDLIDNSNLCRIPEPGMGDVARQEKYNKALRFLMEL